MSTEKLTDQSASTEKVKSIKWNAFAVARHTLDLSDPNDPLEAVVVDGYLHSYSAAHDSPKVACAVELQSIEKRVEEFSRTLWKILAEERAVKKLAAVADVASGNEVVRLGIHETMDIKAAISRMLKEVRG